MSSSVNGSVDRGGPGEQAEEAVLGPDWREHFLRVLTGPRFAGPSRFLHRDIAAALRQSIHHDATVLEAGVGSGRLLASLPNQVRWGIDLLPEAIEQAARLDPNMHLSLADASDCRLGRSFDAIICDRLCHSVRDIQRLLENLSEHLA